MHYIEELVPGDTFTHNNIPYLLGIDFKKNGNRIAISLKNGEPRWLESDSVVDMLNLYSLDKSNNIIPLKEQKNEHTI